MPVGYEYGFTRRLHVVDTRMTDWETPHFDLSSFIERVNRFKMHTPLFQGEGSWTKLPSPSSDLLVLERGSDWVPGERGFLIVNLHSSREQVLSRDRLPPNSNKLNVAYLSAIDRRGNLENFNEKVALEPSEVIAILDNDA